MNMRTIGWCVLSVGILWLIVAINMDTSVESSPGIRVMNFSLIAQQQNQLLIGALISLAGLMCVIFGRNQGGSNNALDVKCPFCAEYIKPDAIKCKHCQSELPRNFSNVAAMNLLEEFKHFSHHDFVGDDGSLNELKIQNFADIGIRYLEVIKQVNGDLTTAEKELLTKIESTATMFDSDLADEFNQLCVKHSPWLVLG